VRPGIWRTVLQQLRSRRGRAAVLGSGILVASTSFSLLAAGTTTSQARVRGTVSQHFRTTYDLLVRPPGSESALERDRGLVRNNFETGIYGGITEADWQLIKSLPGVDVAAPVAYLGWLNQMADVDLPIGTYMRADHPVRLRYSTSTQFGTDIPVHNEYYFVATRSASCQKVYVKSPPQRHPFGMIGAGWCYRIGGDDSDDNPVRTVDDVTFNATMPFPVLVAAVDPLEEDRLLGLQSALVAGRSLHEGEPVEKGRYGPVIPVIASTLSFRGQSVAASVEQLSPPSGVGGVAMMESPLPSEPQDIAASHNWARLHAMPSVAVGSFSYSAAQMYDKLKHAWTSPVGDYHRYGTYISWRAGPVDYEVNPDGSISPKAVVNDPVVTYRRQKLIHDEDQPYYGVSADNEDVQYRSLTPAYFAPLDDQRSATFADVRLVGEYDPRVLAGGSDLNRVPLETYAVPNAVGADARSRRLLHDQPLQPTSNLGGYLAQPPLLITTLTAASGMTDPKWWGTYDGKPLPNSAAPISVIRVRVSSLTGVDAKSVARLRSVAALIHDKTGLVVDVTAGSSPQPQTVQLPAGRFGQPSLTLVEGWTHKGVALVIVSAVDRKSLVLLGLVLLVTTSFLTNASLAATRLRRAELGILAATGWSKADVFRLVLGELVLIAAVAGLVGTALSVVLIEVLGLDMSVMRAIAIPPVAVALACAAGLVPAVRAARTPPMASLRPAVAASPRVGRVGSTIAFARSSIRRYRGRTGLAALTVGIAVAVMAGLFTATLGFRGTIAGSVLGTYVTVEIRGVDYLCAALATGLACYSVADLMALSLRERSYETAVLKATGWSNGQLMELFLSEAAGIALIGAVPAALAVGVLSVMAGVQLSTSVLCTAAAVTIGVVVILAFSILPAVVASRAPVAVLLADE
jgi:putative ABC transport system permease protein